MREGVGGEGSVGSQDGSWGCWAMGGGRAAVMWVMKSWVGWRKESQY